MGKVRYQQDWPEARERLTALWRGERLDRPCIAVQAPSGRQEPWPSPPATAEARWLDPDYITAAARTVLANTWWGGEAIPGVLVMAGWIVCLGGTPRFAPETIWWEPRPFDFERPPELGFEPHGPWVERHTRVYLAVAALAGRDDFLVGRPCLLPANDLLSMLMGTERFLLALVDHPEWMRAAIRQGGAAQGRAMQYYQERLRADHDFWYGQAGWMPFWAPEPYCATQSDVSCMLSPGMFDEFVLPELELLHQAGGPLWYHLDGGDARQHLPRLLSLPWLRVVQYTPAPNEPPNGPAHLALYRQVQASGKIVHLQVPAEHVEPLVRGLDPGLLILDTRCPSVAEGQELLRAAVRWSRSG